MKLRHPLLLAALSLLSTAPAHAAGKLVAGPMLGYAAHREVLIWLETADARRVTLDYWLAGKPETKQSIEKDRLRETPAGGQIHQFRPGLLELGASYEYSLAIDGVKLAFPYPLTFKTRPLWEWRTAAPDFKFIFGTCAYINEPIYDRPGQPYGRTMETFKFMADSGADFMVWGGDNWYYREADFDSIGGLWHRAQHDRSRPELQKLLAVMNHYAIWDDHDFGSDDSNRSFEFKDETLRIFRSYWGNPGYGEPENPGVYHKFFHGDAAFFMMDNRYHRDDDYLGPDDTKELKTQYGARQRDWLKQSLLAAQRLGHFTFKFIVTGGQVITDFGGRTETFAYFRAEREELLKFIKEHKITGVIFLSGDVHFTELAREKLTDTQWVYELTSSPISAGEVKFGQNERAHDPHRVEDTAVDDQNFSLLSVHGPRDDRQLTISCTDKQGVKRWEHTIKAAELR